jgi:hypothetical protein
MMFSLPAVPAGRVAPVGEAYPASIRNAANNTVDIDLGVSRVVRTIGFPLRWQYEELDRWMVVEASLDGVSWSTMWEGWTGGPALAAAIQNPVETPVRLTVADVPARYLRVHPVPPWMVRAIKIYGPK